MTEQSGSRAVLVPYCMTNSVIYYELIIILAINFIMLMNFMGQGIEQGSGSLFLPHGV